MWADGQNPHRFGVMAGALFFGQSIVHYMPQSTQVFVI
jgi:hypothetical protein